MPSWIARAALSLSLVLPSHEAIAQLRATGVNATDSLRWRTQVVTDTLLRRLSPDIEIVRQRGAGVPYIFKFPADTSLVEWSRVRRTLVDTLRAREATDADSLVELLSVEVSRTTPSFAIVRLSVGAKWRCHGSWLGGSSADDIVVSWDTTPPPPIVRAITHSHSLPCRAR